MCADVPAKYLPCIDEGERRTSTIAAGRIRSVPPHCVTVKLYMQAEILVVIVTFVRLT